jgi:predicted nucleotidyltransferase
MDRETIIATLRAHAQELKPAGLVHVWLHGSVVRGESGSHSDVDLAAEFDRAKCRTMLDEISLKNRLSDILGVEADLSNKARLYEEVRVNFDREAELVF